MFNDKIDSVYFLMFPGWETEMRSNRWHFITRWAEICPVTIIQPTLLYPTSEPICNIETRIPNTRILRIQSVRSSPFFDDETQIEIQLAQVVCDMVLHSYTHTLLWTYNPQLCHLHKRLPAIYRVFHATEDYFRFPNLPASFLDLLVLTLQSSDLVVAVSIGVSESIKNNASPQLLLTQSNGCDFNFYALQDKKTQSMGLKRLGARVAIFAGNINSRLDFELLEALYKALPDTQLVFFGPVIIAERKDKQSWARLCRASNFHYLGIATPEQLKCLYAEADVGLIPYRASPVITESGFPLKALEMAATGLPVVTTYMKPLQQLAHAIIVTQNRTSFVAAVRSTDRDKLSDKLLSELTSVAASFSYDKKFHSILLSIGNDWDVRKLTYTRQESQPELLQLRRVAEATLKKYDLRTAYDVDWFSRAAFRKLFTRCLVFFWIAKVNAFRLARATLTVASVGRPKIFDPLQTISIRSRSSRT